MTEYRRYWQKGGTYFFTLNLADRRSDLLVRHFGLLRGSARRVRAHHPFNLDAVVVLPDHMHCIITLPMDSDDFSVRLGMVKSNFSRRILCGEQISASRESKRERGIWQRRFWEHAIRDEEDFRRHMDYIHYNPVKHGMANSVVDWRYSSFHRYARLGVYPTDWASCKEEVFVGER